MWALGFWRKKSGGGRARQTGGRDRLESRAIRLFPAANGPHLGLAFKHRGHDIYHGRDSYRGHDITNGDQF